MEQAVCHSEASAVPLGETPISEVELRPIRNYPVRTPVDELPSRIDTTDEIGSSRGMDLAPGMGRRTQTMRERVTKTARTSNEDEREDRGASTRSLKERGKTITNDIDDLLEEIDGVLEENAEEFVASYVQRGGQ